MCVYLYGCLCVRERERERESYYVVEDEGEGCERENSERVPGCLRVTWERRVGH